VNGRQGFAHVLQRRIGNAQLSRNWWVVVLRGVFAILFGMLAFAWPGLTVAVPVLLFGAYALVDGIFALVAAVANRAGPHRWWVLLDGIVSILAGIVTFVRPGLTALALLYLIAAWSIVTGIFEIMAAIELRKEITNEWLYVLSGVLSVVFGVIIALFLGAGALAWPPLNRDADERCRCGAAWMARDHRRRTASTT
jgi:uncharacterized membrane protein HdeD (DUF308 family)